MSHNRWHTGGPRISYTSRSSPVPTNTAREGRGSGSGSGGRSHRSNSANEPPPFSAHPEDEFNLDHELDPELELELEQGQAAGGSGLDSEEDFDFDDGNNSSTTGGGGGEDGGAAVSITGRYVASPSSSARRRRRSAGNGESVASGGDSGEFSFTPAFSNKSSSADAGWTIGGGELDGGDSDDGHDGWGAERRTSGGSSTSEWPSASGGETSRRSSSGAICIGGGGGSSGVGRGWSGMVITEELRGDGGGDGDFALGKSLDETYIDVNVDTVYRHAEARHIRNAKHKGLGRGGSSGSLAGKDGGGRGGGGGSGGRKGSKANNGFKITGGSSGSSGIVGGGSRRGSRASHDNSGSASGGRRDGREGLRFDGGLAGSGKKNNRSHGPLPVPKQPLSQADTASARKNKTRQRDLEVKKAIKEKGDRCFASEGLMTDPGTSSFGEDAWYQGGEDGGYGPSFVCATTAAGAADSRLLQGDTIRKRIKKQSNRPLDSMVQEAQRILAKALQRGGKRVLLPGLELRYPQNVRALLEDAAQALEHGVLLCQPGGGGGADVGAVPQAPPSWTTYWAPIQVLDLSRNNLEGIESLLVVEVLAGGVGDDQNSARSRDSGGTGEGSGVAARAAAAEKRTYVYPLEKLEDLRLNENKLHGLPRDMDRVLPSLARLELYGNRIGGIKAPERPLMRLKHLNLGYNNLLELPAEACEAMPSLEELLLPNNLLEWLPKELALLKLLRRLDVTRNPLTSPPVEVAARGLDSVKRYFRDVESQSSLGGNASRSGEGPAKDSNVEVNRLKTTFMGPSETGKSSMVKGLLPTKSTLVEVPNQVKVIVIGHSEAGKSEVIRVLSAKTALPQPHQPHDTPTGSNGGSSITGGEAIARSFSTPNPTISGIGTSSSSSRLTTPPSSTSPVFPGNAAASTPHQHIRRGGAPPRTPQPPPPSAPDDDGWQVVGTARQRSVPVPSTPPANRSQERSDATPPSHGVGTSSGGPGASAAGSGGRRWETVATQGGGALGRGQGSWAGGAGSAAEARRSLLTPDSPKEVAMDIRTVTYHTPTSSERGGRKRLSADGGDGTMSRAPQSAAGSGNGDHSSATATPRLSGYGGGGGGGGGEGDFVTLKLWNFGGNEEFHAVHGLFFSGRALYTVVFDLHHVERDEIDERVQFWVDCVQSRVPGSLILLVGTHADYMSQAEAKSKLATVRQQLDQNEERVVNRLRMEEGSRAGADLSHLRNRPKIELQMFAVSCNHHQGFNDFRQHVINLAGDTKRFPTSKLPPTWVEADRLVKRRREEGHHILSVRDLVAGLGGKDSGGGSGGASRRGRRGPAGAIEGGEGWEDSRNAVVSTLEWLNDTSEVVYFNKPGLDEFVILHPIHLMGAIKQIVRRDLKDKLRALVRHHQDREYRAGLASTSGRGGGLLPASVTPCPADYPPLTPSSAPTAVGGGSAASATAGAVDGKGSVNSGGGKSGGSGGGGSSQRRNSHRTSARGSSVITTASNNTSSSIGGSNINGRGGGGPQQPTVAGAAGAGVWGQSARSVDPPALSPSGASAVGYMSARPSPGAQTGGVVSTPSPPSPSPALAAAAPSTPTNPATGGSATPTATSSSGNSTSTTTNKPSYLEKLAKGTGIASAVAGVDQQQRAGGGSISGGASGAAAAAAARRTVSAGSAGSTAAAATGAVLTYRDEVRLNSGFVSRAVVDALLEPLAEFNCDKTGREFLIRLFQESCVLVKATEEPPTRSAPGTTGSGVVTGQQQQHQHARAAIARSQSLESASLSGGTRRGSVARKEQEIEYFIPCILPLKPVEWTESWVSNVHCGRRWRFQRFVPRSLMSALISRFYGMGKRGSAILSRLSIYIKIPIGGSGGNGTGRGRGEAEVYLKLHRGDQNNNYISMQSPCLELLAQAESRRREELMRSLEPLVKEVDKTLDEFPGLLFERRVPCPACMERNPGNRAAWGGLPLEMVEENRSCPGDLPKCKNLCFLQDLQRRLMFVGEMPPADGQDVAHRDGVASRYHHHHHHYNVWDSRLPEVGAPCAIDLCSAGGAADGDGIPYHGFGVPRVDALYPAVCPIAIYDCATARVTAHATAFVVKAEKGYLLTAAHTFVQYKLETSDDGSDGSDNGDGAAPRQGRWQYCDGVTFENCVVLVGMFEHPFTTRWEFVAEALQHSDLVRSKVYSNIGWNKDHPVLLRIKLRFNPVSTRVVENLTFEGLSSDWRNRSPRQSAAMSPTQQQHQHRQPSGLTALTLGDSRRIHNRRRGDVEHLTIFPEAMLEVLKSEDSERDVRMTMAVFPQELLTLVAFPEHAAPYYSSVSVTFGPVQRNMVAQDVIEVLLSNRRGASGGPVVSKRGDVVGILSQGNEFGAYVMGISTAKTLLSAPSQDLEQILTHLPLTRRWKAQHEIHVARAAAARAAASAAAAAADK
eukprot:g8079.t1